VEAEVVAVLPTVDILPVIMIMTMENLIKNAIATVVPVEDLVVGALTVVSRDTFPGNVLILLVVEVEVEVVEDLVEVDALNVDKKDTFLENVLIMTAEEETVKAAVAEEEVEVDVLTVEKRVTFLGNAPMPEEIKAQEEEEEEIVAVAVVAAAQEEVDVLTVESKVIFQESVLKAEVEEGIKSTECEKMM